MELKSLSTPGQFRYRQAIELRDRLDSAPFATGVRPPLQAKLDATPHSAIKIMRAVSAPKRTLPHKFAYELVRMISSGRATWPEIMRRYDDLSSFDSVLSTVPAALWLGYEATVDGRSPFDTRDRKPKLKREEFEEVIVMSGIGAFETTGALEKFKELFPEVPAGAIALDYQALWPSAPSAATYAEALLKRAGVPLDLPSFMALDEESKAALKRDPTFDVQALPMRPKVEPNIPAMADREEAWEAELEAKEARSAFLGGAR